MQNSFFQDYILNILRATPSREKTQELLDAFERRFIEVNEFEAAVIKEDSFEFKDRVFIQLYRLASLERFQEVDTKFKDKFTDRWRYLNRDDEADLVFNSDGSFNEQVQKEISRNHLSLSYLLDDYKEIWKQFHDLTKFGLKSFRCIKDLKEEEYFDLLYKEIKGRISSINTISFTEKYSYGNLVEQAKYCFEVSVEMAVCADFAYNFNNETLAWCALNKSTEFLGLCNGLVAKLEQDKKVLGNQTGKKIVSKTKNECIQASVVRSIVKKIEVRELPERGWADKYSYCASQKEALKEWLFVKEAIGAASLYYNLYHRWLPLSKEQKNDEFKKRHIPNKSLTQEVYVSRFANWMRNDTEFRRAVNGYIDMAIKAFKNSDETLSELPVAQTVDDKLVTIKKSELNKLLEIESKHWSEREVMFSDCPAKSCPKRDQAAKKSKELLHILKKPLTGQVKDVNEEN